MKYLTFDENQKLMINHDEKTLLTDKPDAITFLLIGGGGPGGYSEVYGSGGGGGGGFVYNETFIPTESQYDIFIGSGGTTTDETTRLNGGDTTGFGFTAYGGGYGGNPTDLTPPPNGLAIGGDGGSGGGAGMANISQGLIYFTGGTASQGYSGGTTYWSTAGTSIGAAGGGGIGAVGADAIDSNVGGAGGAGRQFLTFGDEYYAGGGGGGGTTGGDGGSGGGGNGGNNSGTYSGTSGTTNTGGGGGGTFYGPANDGGSGIAKVKYLTAFYPNATGGTVTYEGSYTIHTFTENGTLILVPDVESVASGVWMLFDDMMMGYSIYMSFDNAYEENATGGSGEYEYSADDGSTWGDWASFTSPVYGSGPYSCKVRDKNNITNVANCTPYPVSAPS